MKGDIGHLQRLTDQQVTARLAAYNGDGSLERDIRMLSDDAGDIIAAEVREQFGTGSAERMQAHYASAVNASWIQDIADYGRRIYR